MTTNRETLEDSIDAWTETAQHDRRQALASFAIAAAGIVGFVAGLDIMANGNLAGVIDLGFGATVAVGFVKIAQGELDAYADSIAHVAVRRAQLDQLDHSDETITETDPN